jgi:hypothetical protein
VTTSQFVSLILDEVGSSWTRAQVLDITNNAQNEILGENLRLTRVRPDPFFATTDGTYTYTAASSLYDSSANTQGSLVGDVRTVTELYSYSNSVSIFDNQTLDPASEKPNQFEFTQTKDRVTMRLDCIDSLGPTLSDCTLKIYVTNNPGTTTTTWRAVAYKWPTQLTSENVALSVPADFQDTLLFFEVLKRLERREYGENAFTFQQAEYYRKRFRRKYNAQSDSDLRIAPFRIV